MTQPVSPVPMRRFGLHGRMVCDLLCQCLVVGFLLMPVIVQARLVSFNPAPLRQHAMQLLDEGRFLECVDVWETLYRFSLQPADRALARVRIGDLYALFLDQQSDALTAYGDARQLSAGSAGLENAYFNAGMILYERRALNEAQGLFQAYLALYPQGAQRSTAGFMLERLHRELGGEARAHSQTQGRLAGEPIRGTEPFVRVAVASADVVEFSLPRAVTIQTGQAGQLRQRGQDAQGQKGNYVLPAGRYVCTVSGEALVLNGQPVGSAFSMALAPDQHVQIKDAIYCGEIGVRVHEGKVLMINRLAMETYLQGVVPREMPVSFSESALQAQAVAARSYALYVVQKSREKLYDVTAGTASQVYGGVGVANEKTRRAVLQTRGKVLTYNGNVVLAYFHAHSAGMLEDDRLVWTADLPYYSVQEDAVSNSITSMPWQLVVPEAEVVELLRCNGFAVLSVRAILPGAYSPSGRVGMLALDTPEGTLEMKSNTFRLMVGAERMKSTLCSVQRQGDSFIFSGKGYGHGVGMSQWGAEAMGRAGLAYSTILDHYYPGTVLAAVY